MSSSRTSWTAPLPPRPESTSQTDGRLMIDAERSSGDSTSPIERFIRDFFGRGNIAWPGQDPDSSEGRTVQPYLDVLWEREASEVPVVLPRRREKGGDLTAYVIARDPAHAVVVADLLTAFVGP